jgi:hypothetical protein
MRVAAGVLLILAAVINLIAGFVYLGGGAVMGSMDKLVAVAEEQRKKQGQELTEDEKKQFSQYSDARARMSDSERAKMDTAARVAMIYGLFLLISVGTSIAAAVCLFRQNAVKFIVIASAFALAIEVIGCVAVAVIIGAAIGATKILFSSFGIAGGILGILGARQISHGRAVVADGPPVLPTLPTQP